ncbi:elongation factor P hydroxylase [Paraglaciecola sp. 2405UD69-4]|uniref:elongation factor P hydroxylase n=1 Tax=Paraglaciecola sp. 2405UD69-4 TaxID=3391836 RepID=UPI0039C8E3B7
MQNAPTQLSPSDAMPESKLKEAKCHLYQDLIRLFNDSFAESEQTVLVKGKDEPIYIPASKTCEKHQIVFAHGYFASALHEIAHWCIAGKARRLLEDYGYWYCPDGRNEQEQAEFEKVEVKPQAIEWAFSLACGKSFRVSTDNLNGAPVDSEAFQAAVKQQLAWYLQHGFPPRAQHFIEVLQRFYDMPDLKAQGVIDVIN